MEKAREAKEAVKDFVKRDGHHDTTVHERVAPAVTNETVHRQKHEESVAAVDREVHQDHYHTSIQPVTDREVLPEQHQHRMIPVEHREHKHGKDQAVRESLEQEQRHFHDLRTEGTTKETHETLPTVVGEHVHHHVHETIQPVVQKETIQPSVVHTTVPIHEVHQNDPKHHAASALPAVSMADFKKQGGTLSGREERYDGFAGEPKSIASSTGSGTHGLEAGTGSNTTSGPHASNLANKVDPRVDSDRDGSRNAGLAQTSGTTAAPASHGTHGTPGVDNQTATNGSAVNAVPNDHSIAADPHRTTSGSSTVERKKPSLLDRLNPKKDTDGDGKSGVLD